MTSILHLAYTYLSEEKQRIIFAITNPAFSVQLMFAYGSYKSAGVHYGAGTYQCTVAGKVYYYYYYMLLMSNIICLEAELIYVFNSFRKPV